MSLKRAILGVLALSVLVVGLSVACGGDGDEESGEPAAVTSPEAAEPTAEAAEDEEDGGVIREFTGGSAKATVKVGDQTLTFEGGECAIGTDDEWLAVNIGEVGGDTYFGLTAGKTPASDSARSAEGGGEFSNEDFLVTWVHESSEAAILGGDGRLDVASDLKSGQFEGSDIDGNAVSGSFTCE
jgi:hypothetical protein